MQQNDSLTDGAGQLRRAGRAAGQHLRRDNPGTTIDTAFALYSTTVLLVKAVPFSGFQQEECAAAAAVLYNGGAVGDDAFDFVGWSSDVDPLGCVLYTGHPETDGTTPDYTPGQVFAGEHTLKNPRPSSRKSLPALCCLFGTWGVSARFSPGKSRQRTLWPTAHSRSAEPCLQSRHPFRWTSCCESVVGIHSVASSPNCLDTGLPVRMWRLRGRCAKIRGPYQDKSDRVGVGVGVRGRTSDCTLQLIMAYHVVQVAGASTCSALNTTSWQVRRVCAVCAFVCVCAACSLVVYVFALSVCVCAVCALCVVCPQENCRPSCPFSPQCPSSLKRCLSRQANVNNHTRHDEASSTKMSYCRTEVESFASDVLNEPLGVPAECKTAFFFDDASANDAEYAGYQVRSPLSGGFKLVFRTYLFCMLSPAVCCFVLVSRTLLFCPCLPHSAVLLCMLSPALCCFILVSRTLLVWCACCRKLQSNR